MINGNTFLNWINNPIFPDTGLRVNYIFDAIVQLAAGWGHNFEDQIRSSGTSAVG